MSHNEEHTEASSADAVPGPVAPAPATGNTTTTTPPSQNTSRFYSRLSRGVVGPATTAPAEPAPVFAEGVTADEAVLLKDNLPVRANYDGPVDEEREARSRDRERRPHSDSGDERPGRRRGRGRDRNRDRGERGHRQDKETTASTPAAEEAEETAAETDTDPAESSRRLRFEEASTDHAPRTVQEFRPSRDRSFVADAGRARKRREERAPPAPPTTSSAESKSGLLGWMKSIFNPKPEETPAEPPAKSRGPRREGRPRRNRQGGTKSGAGGSQAHGDAKGDGNRRRRRRGGRNRRRSSGGGGGGRSGAASNA